MRRVLGTRKDALTNEQVQKMLSEIAALKSHELVFDFEMDKSGDWAVESVDFPGLIAGGSINDNMQQAIVDAIFAYFEVSAQYCDDALLLGEKDKNLKNKPVFTFTTLRLATA